MIGPRAVGVLVTCAVAVGLTAGVRAGAQQESEKGKLAVTLEYKGAGTVDKDHRIWVWLFDTPNITADSMPIATDVVDTNGGVTKFLGLPAEVYIAAAYDDKGGYDGSSGPPPAGTPLTIHGGSMGGPAAPVKTGGDDAVVTVSFDDSIRMP